MIRSFRHRGLKRLHERGDAARIRRDQLQRIEDILGRLDVAVSPQEMNLPGHNLYRLKGDLKGFWSVKVSENWHIMFRFEDREVLDADLIDNHEEVTDADEETAASRPIDQGCLPRTLRPNDYRGRTLARRLPQRPDKGDQWSCRHFAGDGHSPGKDGLEHGGILAGDTICL